jgi:cell division protein FtsN
MIVKRKILFAFLILFTICKVSFSQVPNSNWIPIIELPNQSVFIDTTSIKSVENQISVLSLTSYKKPELISVIGKEASNVKSQILFNVPLHKYTIIGTLYYDKNQKILGETSVPGFVANSENFSQSVDSNAVMTAILDKSISVLKKDEESLQQDKNQKPDSKNKTGSAVKNSKELLKNNQDKVIVKSSQIKTPLSANLKDNAQIQKDQSPIRKDLLVKKDPSIKIVSDSTRKKETLKKSSITNKVEETKTPIVAKVIEPKTERSYNSQNESNPKSTIFTDGTKYSFQVSSWKNKSKAENEVQKLKNEHHNAFISEGVVKNTTWYRVRIGFFNSLEETEEYMKKLK